MGNQEVKVPPQNIDAERAVLGAMLMSDEGKEAIPRVVEILGDNPTIDGFYRESHQKIYSAILNLFERGEPADLLTVTRELERTGDLEKVGGAHDFFFNPDLLVLDSQYTLDESFFKFTWGHTSYTMAVNCGIRWRAKNLVLTHHEPSYSDIKLNQILEEAVSHRNAMKLSKPNIFLAREGMTFKL